MGSEAVTSSDRDRAHLLQEVFTSLGRLLCPLSLKKKKKKKIKSFAIKTLGSATTAAAMGSGAVASSDRDWANLLPEILTSIAKLLCPLDYSNFSGVCTSWASIASPANGMPRPLPLRLRKHEPFLLLSGDKGEQSESCNLFDFFTNSYYKIDSLPEIRAKWLVGSQFGWLAVIDELSNPSLLNPFTRSQIQLPPITAYPQVKPLYDSAGTLSGYQSYDGLLLSLQQFRVGYGIRKLVVSSNPSGGNFAAVALYDFSLIFVRPGEGKWNQWIPYLEDCVVDVIYLDGKFLALTNFGDVHVVDFSRPPKSRKDSIFAPDVPDGYCDVTTNIVAYLVDLNGVLLHVLRCSKEVESRYQTYKIDIHSLDPETWTWVPVTNLGDSSLFIGTCCSMSLQASETSWVKKNCVYFNDLWPVSGAWAISGACKRCILDFGIFNLSDGSFETCYPPDEAKLTWPPPTWITSPLI